MAELHRIVAQPVTQEAFLPYGQLVLPVDGGKAFDQSDAQLDLSQGTPRFYLMRLQRQGRCFHAMARHLKCTQCLGSLGGKTWFLAVCPPSEFKEPTFAEMAAFQIPGNCFIKLEPETWHSGPHFDDVVMDFYNLELSDTNITDYCTHNFLVSHQRTFEIVYERQ